MNVELDHIGILVADIPDALESVRHRDWTIADIEEFPAEGTKEVYIGPPEATGMLLLIEPIGEGPYREAMSRRGTGLHHIAINVQNVQEYSRLLAGSGWYLHPSSVATFANHRTVWAARPGAPTLLEIVEREGIADPGVRPRFVTSIEVPIPAEKPEMASSLGVSEIRNSPDGDIHITFGDERSALRDLVRLGTK